MGASRLRVNNTCVVIPRSNMPLITSGSADSRIELVQRIIIKSHKNGAKKKQLNKYFIKVM